MSELSLFLKKNKATRENVKYAASKGFLDENGKPVEWEIRPVTSRENEALREECMVEAPSRGRRRRGSQYRVDTVRYLAKLMAASVVFPDLQNAELQDSYGVKTPEDLVKELLDNPGEYMDFSLFLQELNGFDIEMEDDTEQAKN